MKSTERLQAGVEVRHGVRIKWFERGRRGPCGSVLKGLGLAGFLAALAGQELMAGEQARQIPVDDIDNWFCEYYLGGEGGLEGARQGRGICGAMAFDAYGNVFIGGGSIVTVVTPDDKVHRVAGIPGIPGGGDGSADLACLAGVNAMACHPTDCFLYVSDIGNLVIKKISRGKDGRWSVATVAGRVGVAGHKDGGTGESLLQRVDGIALDSKGNLYMADQDWLRRLSPDGQLVTLNPKGGSGSFGPGLEHELESVKFNRIMGAGQLACDENDDLFIGDKWNGTWLKIDFKAGKAIVIAGGPARGEPGFRSGAPGRDGAGNTEAIFHTGGGPSGLAYDRLTKRLYNYTADEHAVRVILPDGMVRTLGPWQHYEKGGALTEGPVKETKGYASLAGCDLQGRVYVVNRDGRMYRFYRKPAIENAPAPKTPDPLLPWPADTAKSGPSLLAVTLDVPEGESVNMLAGKAAECAGPVRTAGAFNAEINAGGKVTKLSYNPAKAVLGDTAMTVETVLVDKGGLPPECAVKATVSGGTLSAPVVLEIAPAGGSPVVVSAGTNYVAAYNHAQSIYAKRISIDGRVLDQQPVKLGGQWEYSPAMAVRDGMVVVTGSRRPYHNPWGWNGPGAVSIGRLMPDGRTPERFVTGFDGLADGGYAGLVDRARWKGKKGWPAGIPGGFKDTENGYWPGRLSTVCWDGKTWVVAWERNRVRGPVDTDIFACRVDPETMMPVGEPVLAAGGSGEPGVQLQPVILSLGDGRSVLIYAAVQSDGQVKTMARILAGGAVIGPARVEPKKGS